MKKLIVITGPSGAGLSSAKFVFEERGYYVVENPTVEVISPLIKSFNDNENIHNFVLILNITTAKKCLDIIKNDKNFETMCILLSANKNELMKRYTLSRHAHVRSVMEGISIEKAVDEDIVDANNLSPDVDVTIDTSNLSIKSMRQMIYDLLSDDRKGVLNVNFISFGLKNGVPAGIDMIFDVRSIPNPFWVDDLKELTGYDQKVIDYLESFPKTHELIQRIEDFLTTQLKDMVKEGRVNYNIGIACSGGQHRSTYVAKVLKDYFAGEYDTHVIHRDTPALNENK